jgi:hypothetical protein
LLHHEVAQIEVAQIEVAGAVQSRPTSEGVWTARYVRGIARTMRRAPERGGVSPVRTD